MKISAVTSVFVGLVMATCVAALPTSGDKIDPRSLPSTLSDAVRADLAKRHPSSYTLHTSSSNQLAKRDISTNPAIITSCHAKKHLAITFDDGPYENHKNLVDQFDAIGSKATFFVNGNNWRCVYDKDQVSALRYSYKRGHQICSHTWSHPNLTTLNDEQLDRQVQLVEDALWKIIGAVPACIRAPYGEIRDDQVERLQNKWGLKVIGWSNDTRDADGAQVEESVKVYKGLFAPTCAIILNHETVGTTVTNVIPRALKIIKKHHYKGSSTVARISKFQPYKVVGDHQHRDDSWTCDGKPAAGQA
ncbi:hypothetical protein ACQY0O_000246 [Thecaphora frezii]|nr:putative carbohydrate esterase family 4 protein [Thecaphora frezii]